MKSTKYLYISAIIGFVLFSIFSIVAYALKIVSFGEFLIYFTFCTCGGISLWILKEDDPIGHILRRENFRIKQKKILPVSIMISMIGVCFLADVIFYRGQTECNVFSIIAGVSCILFGIFGIVNYIIQKQRQKTKQHLA